MDYGKNFSLDFLLDCFQELNQRLVQSFSVSWFPIFFVVEVLKNYKLLLPTEDHLPNKHAIFPHIYLV